MIPLMMLARGLMCVMALIVLCTLEAAALVVKPAGLSSSYWTKTVHSSSLVVVCHASRNENKDAEGLASSFQQEEEKWRDARIRSCRPACASGKSMLIQLEVDEITRQEYTIPGQFVQFQWKNENAIFLAMASAPSNEDCFEFLIKKSPRLAWLDEALQTDNIVQISRVLGNGFPLSTQLDDEGVDRILLLAAGSGIAPLKACIESGQLPARSPHNKLYYGEWTADDLCFTDLYDTWKQEYDVTVIPVLSRTENSRDYVQQVLRNDGISSPQTTAAIVCGMDDMVESVSSVLTAAGVEENRILLNL